VPRPLVFEFPILSPRLFVICAEQTKNFGGISSVLYPYRDALCFMLYAISDKRRSMRSLNWDLKMQRERNIATPECKVEDGHVLTLHNVAKRITLQKCKALTTCMQPPCIPSGASALFVNREPLPTSRLKNVYNVNPGIQGHVMRYMKQTWTRVRT